MIKFIVNKPVLSLVFCVIIIFALIQVSKSVGFCSARVQLISDESYIEMALEHSFENRVKRTQSDVSVKAYIKNHPKCCEIKTTSPLDLLDSSAREVYLNYPVKGDVIQSLGGASFYESYLYLSSCGKVLDTKGFGSSSPFSNNY